MNKSLILTMFVVSTVSMHAENSSNKKKEEISGYEMEQVVVLSEKAQKALKTVKEVIEVPYQSIGYEFKKMETQYKQYKDAVEALGLLITAEQVNSIQERKELTLDQALAVMAYNVTNCPESLEELLEYYKRPIYKGRFRPRVILPAELDIKHWQDKYRSSWEYLLLAPQAKHVRFINSRGGHFVNALYMTNNIHTVPILDYLFSVKVNSRTYDKVDDSVILFMIGRFPTGISLNYLLRGLDRCRDDVNGEFFKRYRKSYPEKIIIIMSGANNHWAKIKVDRLKWKEVILEYPKDDLPRWQKDFLNDVLNAIDEQEKIESERKTEKDK